MGADFGGVRVHTGAQADRLSRSVSAEAFTVGSDIFFRKGSYTPSAASGQRLLAHELTHVVQQGGSKANKVQAKLSVGPAGDAYEQEAERVSAQVTQNPTAKAQRKISQAATGGPRLQRALSAKALAAMQHANNVTPGYTTNNILNTDEITWYQNAQWLPAKTSDEIIKVRNWLEKATQATDQAAEDRIMQAKAYLLKVFTAEWIVAVQRVRQEAGNQGQLTDLQRKAAIPMALRRTEREKKRLLNLGLIKPGLVKPELMQMTTTQYTAERDNPNGLNFSMDVDRNVIGQGSTVDTTPRIEWRGTKIPNTGSALRKLGLRVHSLILYTDNAGLLPFALKIAYWTALLAAGANGSNDNYTYNPATGAVSSGPDGVPELNLYPGSGGGQLPPGNFGTVDVGSPNNSTADISRQIRYGVNAEDMSYFGGELTLGPDGTLTLNGDTGLSAAVKDDLESVKGLPRAIPLFTSVSGNGNNSNFVVVGFAGVRIMYVKLTGSMSGKQVIIQPALVIDGTAIAGADYTATSGMLIFPPGATAQMIDVFVTGETMFEVTVTRFIEMIREFRTIPIHERVDHH